MVKGKDKTNGKGTLEAGNGYSAPFRESSTVLLIHVYLWSQIKHLIGTCHPLKNSLQLQRLDFCQKHYYSSLGVDVRDLKYLFQ